MTTTYNGVTWNPEDLISSKQAIRILLSQGVIEEELLELDFGNLDVESVIEEYYNE